MAARFKIIILEKQLDLGPNRYRVALWADVPAARQTFYANATAKSAWKDAIAGDLTALQNGSVVERVDQFSVDPSLTLAQIQAGLQADWTSFQNDVTNKNYWPRYGTTWDGTTWVATSIP